MANIGVGLSSKKKPKITGTVVGNGHSKNSTVNSKSTAKKQKNHN